MTGKCRVNPLRPLISNTNSHKRRALTLPRILAFKRPPFKISESGWGEFDMLITLSTVDKGGDHAIAHDLNFQSEHYESKHSIVRLYSDIVCSNE